MTGGVDSARHRAASLARTVADLYAPFGWWRRFYARVRVGLSRFDQIEDFVPPGGHVLDLGCGYGVTANYLALSSPARTVVGIDLNEERIRVGQRTALGRPNLSFVLGDALAAPLREFDVVLMSDMVHHLPPPDQERLFKKLYDHMPPGSALVLQEVGARPRWKHVMSCIADSLLYAFEPLHFRTPEGWSELLAASGFQSVRVIPGDKGSVFARVSIVARR